MEVIVCQNKMPNHILEIRLLQATAEKLRLPPSSPRLTYRAALAGAAIVLQICAVVEVVLDPIVAGFPSTFRRKNWKKNFLSIFARKILDVQWVSEKSAVWTRETPLCAPLILFNRPSLTHQRLKVWSTCFSPSSRLS